MVIFLLNDDLTVLNHETTNSNGYPYFYAYNGNVTFSVNQKSSYYTYGRIIKVNVRFHIAKTAALSTKAQLFKMYDADANQNIGTYGKFFLCYGSGGGTALIRKFTSSTYTDGPYFVQDAFETIPSSYQSNNADSYLLYLDFVSYYSRTNM